MGLFSKFFGTEPDVAELTENEAFGAVVLISVAIDGDISDEELITLAVSLEKMEMFEDYEEDDYSEMFEKVAKAVKKQGTDAVMQMAADALDTELKETAFAMSVDLLLADGEVSEKEEVF